MISGNDNMLNDFDIRVDLYADNRNNKDNRIFESIIRSISETGNTNFLTCHSRSETKPAKYSNVYIFCVR